MADEERPDETRWLCSATPCGPADSTGIRRSLDGTIAVDGKPFLVAWRHAAGFHFPDATTEIWKPILLDADALSDNNRGSHGYTVLASIKKGLTIDQAQGDLNAVAAGFQAGTSRQLPQRLRCDAAAMARRNCRFDRPAVADVARRGGLRPA